MSLLRDSFKNKCDFPNLLLLCNHGQQHPGEGQHSACVLKKKDMEQGPQVTSGEQVV